jgi:CBS domain-containing protein
MQDRPTSTIIGRRREEGWDVIVREVMSERPVWVTPETDVVVVAARMSDHGLGALPVCERGRVVGMITDRDVVFRYFTKPSHEGRLVAHYMTRDPITIEPDQSLEQAEELMTRHHIRRLPVCEEGRLVGMIARGDLARHASRNEVEQLARA